MKAPSQQALPKHIDIKRAWFMERQESGDLLYEYIRMNASYRQVTHADLVVDCRHQPSGGLV